MKLSDFDYTLPKELIAQYPLKERESARLMVLNRKKKTIEHRAFRDITEYLRKDDLLILNDTKVLPGRLIGRRITGGKAEVLLLNRKSGLTFNALLKPGRLKLKEKIIFNNNKIQCEITGRNEVKFSAVDIGAVYGLGVMPLPPYIKRPAEGLDTIYYQTVYAHKDGAAASPTAGLHFTKELLARIESLGINIAYVTLHVGLGTFRPVRAEDITQHKMEEEEFNIPAATIRMLRQAKKENSRIIAVGTTSLRVLETAADMVTRSPGHQVTSQRGLTNLFIYPSYKFKIADSLLTNFHLPRTTLFMLACAFCAAGASASGGAGIEFAKKAYQEAIDKKYRFYSYGDAMLIV